MKEEHELIKICKELGCCDACCLRYLGLKNPSAYENSRAYVEKYTSAAAAPAADEDEPSAAKRQKTADAEEDVCVSCLGVLQEEATRAAADLLRTQLRDKGYECEEFAIALSAPMATLIREKVITLLLKEALPEYNESGVTPLKEAWKWSCGGALAAAAGRALVSGARAALLATVALRYAGEARELAALRRPAPATRPAAERALHAATLSALRAARLAPPPRAPRAAVHQVLAEHAPLYLGGRYVKRSRTLPQTPWTVRGERVMPSSVQELICAPLAAVLGMSAAEGERRLKFMSAGREDVDVRCLGAGRPFALEVCDPRRVPSEEELAKACRLIEQDSEKQVSVARLQPVTREQLAELKRGEETKCKTYEALIIKLAHTDEDLAEGAEGAGEVRVSARDLRNVVCAADVSQRTPLRVLHRRGLLARARAVRALHAAAVPGHAALLALRLETDAGTYVKEWVHGDLGRTRPALADVLRAPADILALDVTRVHLHWP